MRKELPKPRRERPDYSVPDEVTREVCHPKTGKCSLDGTMITITLDKNSHASFNLDPRTRCPACGIALA
jgi:hypothetical protein